MTSGAPDPTVDDRLDRFIADWHAGAAPSASVHVDAAPAEQRAELAELIAAFLELAPSVPVTDPDAAARLSTDPLVRRIADYEERWWAQREAAAPFGARLRALREAAGLSLTQLAAAFADRFSLGADDAGRAPTVFSELEAGALPATGVTARAARALEELLAAAPGALLGGDAAGAQPMASPLLRGELPESLDERERLAELLRTADEAVNAGAPAASETLASLLGA